MQAPVPIHEVEGDSIDPAASRRQITEAGDRTYAQPRSGLTLAHHSYQDVDRDFEILDKPATDPVKLAWTMYHKHLAEHGHFRKKALKLGDMAPFARHLWMVEYHEHRDRFTVRLWSSGCTEVLGVELTGKEIEESGPVGKWPKLYRQVIKQGEPVVLRNQMSETDKNFLSTEVAVLPLWGSSNKIEYILCPFSLL